MTNKYFKEDAKYLNELMNKVEGMIFEIPKDMIHCEDVAKLRETSKRAELLGWYFRELSECLSDMADDIEDFEDERG